MNGLPRSCVQYQPVHIAQPYRGAAKNDLQVSARHVSNPVGRVLEFSSDTVSGHSIASSAMPLSKGFALLEVLIALTRHDLTRYNFSVSGYTDTEFKSDP